MKLVYNGFDIQNMFLFKQSFASRPMLYSETVMDLPHECFDFVMFPPFFYKNRQRLKFSQILNSSSYVVVKVEKRGLWICPGYCLTLDGGYKSTDLSSFSADQHCIQEIFSFLHVLKGNFFKSCSIFNPSQKV